MEKLLNKLVLIMFANLIIAALITFVQQPLKSAMAAGLGVTDVFSLVSIVAGILGDKKSRNKGQPSLMS